MAKYRILVEIEIEVDDAAHWLEAEAAVRVAQDYAKTASNNGRIGAEKSRVVDVTKIDK